MLFAFGTEISTCFCIELMSTAFTDNFDEFGPNEFIPHISIY